LRITFFLLFIVGVLVIGCNDYNESCVDFISDDEIIITEYLDPNPAKRTDRSLGLSASVERAEDLDLSYLWEIDDKIYFGSFVQLTGNGVKHGELTISNLGCTITKQISIDFDRPSGTIGCQVWTDSRSSMGGSPNMYDATDIPMQDVVVELIDANSLEVKQIDTTDVTGRYAFLGVLTGEYYVKIHKPNHDNTYLFLSANAGADDNDCDIIDESGLTELIVLRDWEERMDIGAGFKRCYIQDISCESSHPCFGKVSIEDIKITLIKDQQADADGYKSIIASATIPHQNEADDIDFSWHVNSQTYIGPNVSIKGQGIQKAVLSFSKGGCSISKDLTFDFN